MRQHSHRAAFLTGCLLLSIGCAALAGGALVYPPAPRGNVVDDYHGTAVADPYRWLEGLDSPATRSWTEAEAKLTQGYLSATPLRARLARRIAALYNFEAFGVPFREGGRYFYTRNSGRQDQAVLYVTPDTGVHGAVGVDPNRLSPEGIVTGYVASRDGRLLAYGVSVGGSDWTEWRIRDLATGQDLPDVLRFTKYYPPAFARDGKGLYYSAFPAPPPGAELSTRDLDAAVYYHALGTPGAGDRRLLYDRSHPDWQYLPHLSDDGRWLVVTSGEGEVGDKGRENVYLIDLDATAPAAQAVAEGFEAAYNYIGSDAGRLYFLTTLAAPNGRVIAIDPAAPARSNWRTAIPEGADAIDLTTPSVTLVDHQLIVRSVHDAHSRVMRYGLDGTPRGEIVLPGPGTAAGFGGRAGDRETFYSFRDLITPPTVYRY
ncbi:MAG TPA: hypothetical protein VEC59_04425, partial [Steroidobacteraceae bacterium]|nr:hypothetical protein [Steroidobacteraceae bacterium]